MASLEEIKQAVQRCFANAARKDTLADDNVYELLAGLDYIQEYSGVEFKVTVERGAIDTKIITSLWSARKRFECNNLSVHVLNDSGNLNIDFDGTIQPPQTSVCSVLSEIAEMVVSGRAVPVDQEAVSKHLRQLLPL